MSRRPPRSTLFPYPTLFRSLGHAGAGRGPAWRGFRRFLSQLFSRRYEPRYRFSHRNHRPHFGCYPRKNPFSRRFHLDNRLIGLDFKQRLTLSHAFAFFLSPRQELPGFLRHVERRHHHTDRHSVCHEPRTRLQSVAATPSAFALAATISFTLLLGGASCSRVVESGPFTVS